MALVLEPTTSGESSGKPKIPLWFVWASGIYREFLAIYIQYMRNGDYDDWIWFTTEFGVYSVYAILNNALSEPALLAWEDNIKCTPPSTNKPFPSWKRWVELSAASSCLWWYSKPNLSRIFSNQPGDSPTEPIKLHLLCQFGEALQWFLMAKGLGGFACLWLSAIVSQAWRCWIPEPSNVSKTEVKPSNCPFHGLNLLPHCWAPALLTDIHISTCTNFILYILVLKHETSWNHGSNCAYIKPNPEPLKWTHSCLLRWKAGPISGRVGQPQLQIVQLLRLSSSNFT